jgi:rRNA maturation endonuclease Nob1
MSYIISESEYYDYLKLKAKNTPMKKKIRGWYKRCPMCSYVVDDAVPKQKYCDRCGQRLKG